MYKFIVALKKLTDDLIGRRNAAIHCIIETTWPVPSTTFFGTSAIIQAGWSEEMVSANGTTKPSKLSGKDIEAELKDCISESVKLINAIKSFLDALSGHQAP